MRRRGRVARWAVRTATALSVLVLATAGVGHAVVTGLDGGVERVDPFRDMKNRPVAGHGTNLLLVGTDGRDRITRQERRRYRLGGAPCHCTDTLMIVHLAADRSRASVVSLPRDSYATVPAHRDPVTGKQLPAHPVKLNAAYAEGGPQLTVRTVEHMTHVRIDHYLEVDFTAFMKTVDALGGVEICTPERLKDSYTGLDLAAGKHLLTGGQALQYVRSRHVDGSADLGRMTRQQRFLAALIARAVSSGLLLDPARLATVARTALGSVRADPGLGPRELVDLARAMHGFSPESSEFTTVPVRLPSRTVPGLGSTVRWDPAGARRLFGAVRGDRPLAVHHHGGRRAREVPVPPGRIRVQVVNGTSVHGLGARVDRALHAAGFATTGTPRNATGKEVEMAQKHRKDGRQRPAGKETPQEKAEGKGTAEGKGMAEGKGTAERRETAKGTGRETQQADGTHTEHTLVVYDPRWDRSAASLAAALPGSELRAQPGGGPVLKVIAGSAYHGLRPVHALAHDPARPDTVTGDQVACP